MNKLFTVNLTMPGYEDCYVDFKSNSSLSDADVILFNPDPGSISSFNPYWYEEISHVLAFGKTIVVLLSHPHNHLYSFLPFLAVDFIPTNKIEVYSKSTLVDQLNDTLKEDWNVQCHLLSNEYNENILFASKNNDRVLGALFKVLNGHVILLPNIKFSKIKRNAGNLQFTDESKEFAKRLVQHLSDIHNVLNAKVEVTTLPEWADFTEFELADAKKLSSIVAYNLKIIDNLLSENDELLLKMKEKEILKNLLFETGKPLEEGVIKALKILGYSAENYNDGVLELDQVILSPEGERFIGECEGKENKAIDISKFRQLQDSLNEDFHREEITEKAYGILFGNPQRLLNPIERTLDFTEKCKKGAARELIALVNTVDLFRVARFLSENDNEEFKVECRNAIKEQLGSVIAFPKLPAE